MPTHSLLSAISLSVSLSHPLSAHFLSFSPSLVLLHSPTPCFAALSDILYHSVTHAGLEDKRTLTGFHTIIATTTIFVFSDCR
jgi:hypothetical protein